MDFRLGGGKLNAVKKEEKVEEKKVEASNPFNDLVNQTAVQATTQIKQEQASKTEVPVQATMPGPTPEQIMQMQQRIALVQQAQAQQEMERARTQQMEQERILMLQAQQQQAQQTKEVTINIVMINGLKYPFPMPINQLSDFKDKLDTSISENTTFQVDNITMNCRNIIYYEITE